MFLTICLIHSDLQDAGKHMRRKGDDARPSSSLYIPSHASPTSSLYATPSLSGSAHKLSARSPPRASGSDRRIMSRYPESPLYKEPDDREPRYEEEDVMR
jgi:hypothetical protein